MRRFLFRRRLVLRIIVVFSALLFISVFILTLIFSTLYTDVLFDAVTAEHRDLLTQMTGELERLHHDVLNGYIGLATASSTVRFLHDSERSTTPELAVRGQIRQFLHLRSQFHSISVYNVKDNYFISTAFSNKSEEADLERVFVRDITEPFVVVPRSIPNKYSDKNEQAQVPVLTYAFRVPLRAGSDPSDMIVMNVHDPLMNNHMVGNESPASQPKLILSTQDGFVLSSHNLHESEAQLLYKEVVEHLNTANGSRIATFMTAMLGGPAAVSYALSESHPPFVMISVHDMAGITEAIHIRRNRILWISLAVFLSGGLAVFFLAQLIYRPISRLLARIDRQLTSSGSKGFAFRQHEDLEFALKSFSETIRQMRVLENLNQSRVESIKQSYLHQVIADPGTSVPPDGVMEDLNAVALRVCICAIDGYYRTKPSSRSYISQWIKSAVIQHLSNTVRVDIIWSQEGLVAVVIWDEPQGQKVDHPDYWADLQRATVEELNHSLTVGIGPPVSNLREARRSYLIALGCVEARFIGGYGQVYTPNIVCQEAECTQPYPEDIENHLVQAIRLGSRKQLRENLSLLEKYLTGCRSDNALQICEGIYFACAKLLLSFSGSSVDTNFNISDRFREIDCYRQFAQSVETLLDQFCEYSGKLFQIQEDQGRSELISQVWTYVREQYSDVNLAVETLAERFGYSPSYFGRLFKQATGESLNDLIRSVRIEHAKELLIHTDTPIHEIANKVGFGNEKYFYYVFKRCVGLTPQLFRLRENKRETVDDE